MGEDPDPVTLSSEDIRKLEKSILNWLQNRPAEWRWAYGGRFFTKAQSIESFKKDKEFHRLILEAALLKSINDFKV